MSIPRQRRPHRFANYLATHNSAMEHLRRIGFIVDDTIEFVSAFDGIDVVGHIACQGNIVISVDKHLKIVDGSGQNVRVIGERYS